MTAQVRILRGNTFVVSDSRGDIEASPTDPSGPFAWDTRFLSAWVLTVDGRRLNALSVDDLQFFETRFFLAPGTGTVYIDAKLSVIRHRRVTDGFHEVVTVLNHGERVSELTVRFEADADFADLFDIKNDEQKKGRLYRRAEKDRLVFGYERETFHRSSVITASPGATVDEHGLSYTVRLAPQQSWSCETRASTSRTPTRGRRPRAGRAGWGG